MDTTSVIFFLHIVLACVSLVQRRREKLAYGCLLCSSVDEKKNRRSKNMKMTQPRIKPIATSRGKEYNERKHLTTRRNAIGAPKKTVRGNERGTRRLEDMEPTPRRQQTIT